MSQGSGSNIWMDVLKSIYSYTGVETKEAQPIFILPRDTVRSFLHEKIDLIGIQSRVLGLAGVEVTLIAALTTASFQDFFGIKGNLIQGTFVAFSVIFGLLLTRDIARWWHCRDALQVDSLANDLGSRGSIIRGPSPKDSIET